MGHVGMQPQLVHAYGAFESRVEAGTLGAKYPPSGNYSEELALWRLCSSACPQASPVISARGLRIRTIGIGAGAGCDGQILVLQDLLGMNTDFRPKFARPLSRARVLLEALASFDQAVKRGRSLAVEESYS